jgi:hypothetical protein
LQLLFLRIGMKLKRWMLVVGFVVCGTVAVAQPGARKPVLEWQRLYGEEGFEEEFAGIVSAGASSWAVASQARKQGVAADLSSRHLVLRVLAPDGQVQTASQFQRSAATKGPGVAVFGEERDLVALSSGDLVHLVTVEAGVPAVLKTDRLGKELAFELLASLKGAELQKLLPLPDGGFVLLGQRNADFFLARIDGAGKLLWQKTEDAGAIDVLTDGVVLSPTQFLVVGGSGEYDILERGSSKVWVKKYDTDGKLISENSFPGRRARLGATGEGYFHLAYDQSASDAQQIVVQRMSEGLATVWSTRILEAPSGYSTFRVTGDPSGGVVVVGAKAEKPYVVGLDRQGGRQWEFWGRDLLSADEYGIAMSGKTVFVGSSVFAPTEGGKFVQRVRVFKLVLS